MMVLEEAMLTKLVSGRVSYGSHEQLLAQVEGANKSIPVLVSFHLVNGTKKEKGRH